MLKSSARIIQEGWQLYAKHWRRFVSWLFLLILPALAISVSSAVWFALKNYLTKFSFISGLAVLIIFLAGALLAGWAALALLRAIVAAGSSQSMDWKKIIARPGDLVWLIVWISFVVGLVAFGGSLLLTIFILIFAAIFNFIFYVMVFENTSSFGTLRACRAILAGQFTSALWRLITQGIILSIISYLLAYILIFLIKLIPLPLFLESTLIAIIPTAAVAAIIPLSIASTLALYQSAKQNQVRQITPTPPSQP